MRMSIGDFVAKSVTTGLAFVLIDKALLTIGSDRDVFGHTESPLNGRARIFVASIAHVEHAFIW